MSRKNENDLILKRMKQLGISYKQLAQHVMLSVDTIKMWIDGKEEIPYSCALEIFDILSVNCKEVLKKR
jgi:ribosome-binding protein aMBF1 (putative translation factor)